MSMGAADETRMQEAGEFDIVDETTLSSQQRLVLDARHTPSDQGARPPLLTCIRFYTGACRSQAERGGDGGTKQSRGQPSAGHVRRSNLRGVRGEISETVFVRLLNMVARSLFRRLRIALFDGAHDPQMLDIGLAVA